MEAEKKVEILPNGTVVTWGYSSFASTGTIIGYKPDVNRYFVLKKDKRESELVDPESMAVIPPQPKGRNQIARAYKIWVLGMILSLTGIFVGQWLGDFYKNPVVYYAVSGIWACIMGGTSAFIGFIFISKQRFE